MCTSATSYELSFLSLNDVDSALEKIQEFLEMYMKLILRKYLFLRYNSIYVFLFL